MVSALPHTHLQGKECFSSSARCQKFVLKKGKSVWTKLIRNATVAQYLFNADSYDFNYQFQYRLPKPIQLYRVQEVHTI